MSHIPQDGRPQRFRGLFGPILRKSFEISGMLESAIEQDLRWAWMLGHSSCQSPKSCQSNLEGEAMNKPGMMT